MNPESSKEIKLRMKDLKEGLAKRSTLQAKREELEQFLIETQKKAQNTLMKAHQTNEEMLYSKAADYEKLCQELLHKLRLLDKEIDKWEDVEDMDASWLEERLIHNLLKEHPEQLGYIEILNTNKSKWLSLQHQNDRLIALLANLEHLIATLQLTRARIKRQGIFSYIFGTSPNMMITQCLKGISTVLQEEKNTIAALQEYHPGIKEALIELAQYANDLDKDCQKRWGYRQLDAFIEKNILKIAEFKLKFAKFQTEIESELNKLEKELQSWIGQFND